jgi:hypothetical protein
MVAQRVAPGADPGGLNRLNRLARLNRLNRVNRVSRLNRLNRVNILALGGHRIRGGRHRPRPPRFLLLRTPRP